MPKREREDKYSPSRFDLVALDYLVVGCNALTPSPPVGEPDIFEFAAERGAGVLINKPLARGC
ncbi:hypothetical protein DPM19_12150 [Actinomadura craniellae]|uniref:Uncharacterized protein n=1 Tax=Actinomadura craniellae TaxID=2231787 RepID=A0A365H901_9ACTN|nr:hypothetical protein DPM19_12150 [Actinomadura craniellae]